MDRVVAIDVVVEAGEHRVAELGRDRYIGDHRRLLDHLLRDRPIPVREGPERARKQGRAQAHFGAGGEKQAAIEHACDLGT